MRTLTLFCFLLFATIPETKAQPTDSLTVMLETFGATAGLLAYNTYIVIGVMADGYEGEVYDSAEVITYVEEQKSAMENMAIQFDALYDAKFMSDPADQTMVLEFADICDLLRAEAEALIKYVQDPTDENANLFQESRHEAWEFIAELLGIE